MTEQTPPACASHHETQHRDGKPPWCNACGWRHATPARPAELVANVLRLPEIPGGPPSYFPTASIDPELAQRLQEEMASGRGDAGHALPPGSGLRVGVVEELRFVPDTLATYAGDRAGPLTHPIVELGSVLRAQLGHPERIRIWIEAAE